MKKRHIILLPVTGGVFLFQMNRGFVPNAQPYVVVFSALLSALLAGALVWALVWTIPTFLKKAGPLRTTGRK